MKRPWLPIVLFALCILSTMLLTLPPAAKASPAPTPLDVKVDHAVEIRNGGLLIVTDTLKLSSNGENVTLDSYTLGFPYLHQFNLDYAFAYKGSDPDLRLKLELGVGLGRIGFYGVKVDFVKAVNIASEPYEFTVVFVFSNSILPVEFEGVIMYNASFPAYPSLTQTASEANLTIIFPTGLNYTDSSFEKQGINFTKTVAGSRQHFFNVTRNLSAFFDQPGWFVMAKSGSALELLEVNEVKREIEFSGLEQMVVTDSYKVVNDADTLSDIKVKLPEEAFDVSAFDEFGLIPTDKLKVEQGEAYTNVTITFGEPYLKGVEAPFSVHYMLPWKDYVITESWSDFYVSLTLFENFDWTIRKLTTTIILPEGAAVLSLPSADLSIVQNDAFRDSLTFVVKDATPFHNLSLDFAYKRVVFWESFHSTLWMGALVMVIGAIVGAWRVYQPPTAPLTTAIIPVRVEELRSFVDSYDEKRRYLREIESLEAQARKGKIPRRRYKVRRMAIESRLASLSRDSAALREKIRLAGPRYADLMRQLEVAETELEGVEADITRTEVRYRRGEISPGAYHKLLEDSFRRRDRAQTTIDGVLLRLREEIS